MLNSKEITGSIPTLNIGILGYAFMGKAHVNGYKQLSYMMWPPPAVPNLYLICGRDEEKVSEAAKRYGFKGYHLDWKELVSDERVDIFDNCAPNSLHFKPTVEAMKNGKHVICEKPLAVNSKLAYEMYKISKDVKGKTMVAFNYRFIPAVILAKQLINEGRMGKIYHFRAQYLQEGLVDPDRPLTWRLRREFAGKGVLGDLGSHIIDLARYLVGEIAAVSGLTRTFIKERPLSDNTSQKGSVDVDDAFESVIEFENGAIGTIGASKLCHGRKNYMYFEINGSKGSVRFNLERLDELEVYFANEGTKKTLGFKDVMVTEPSHPFTKYWWPHGHIIGWGNLFAHELYHFMDCIINDKDVTPQGATFEDGYKVTKICDSIAESSLTGKRMELKFDINKKK